MKRANAELERALDDKVSALLVSELDRCQLRLDADSTSRAASETARDGARLLAQALERCYPMLRAGGCEVSFGSHDTSRRIKMALAFGGLCARLLRPTLRGATNDRRELLCALFNLGIGLVDGLCDHGGGAGLLLLETIARQNLLAVAEHPRARGWLRAAVPVQLADHAEIGFAAEVIEAFYALLHELYPGAVDLDWRHSIGQLLLQALQAEAQSVGACTPSGARLAPMECSRLTSVLPFEIIDALALGPAKAISAPTAASALGNAMWRIDDLVDLTEDARNVSLNGVWLAALDGQPEGHSTVALERGIAAARLARAAHQAVEDLSMGLHLATGGVPAPSGLPEVRGLLYFVQTCAGLAPRRSS